MKINVNNAEIKISAGDVKQFPRERLPQIVLSGRSNVGKSSMINALLGRKSLARVSSSPGKTVTLNFYDIDGKIIFADLPGYGYARRSRDTKRGFSTLTESYFLKNPSSDLIKLVIQLIDVRIGPTEDDLMMIDFLSKSGLPFIVTATKADKLSPSKLIETVSNIEETFFSGTDIRVIPFSSVTGQGKQELWKLILKAAE